MEKMLLNLHRVLKKTYQFRHHLLIPEIPCQDMSKMRVRQEVISRLIPFGGDHMSILLAMVSSTLSFRCEYSHFGLYKIYHSKTGLS